MVNNPLVFAVLAEIELTGFMDEWKELQEESKPSFSSLFSHAEFTIFGSGKSIGKAKTRQRFGVLREQRRDGFSPKTLKHKEQSAHLLG